MTGDLVGAIHSDLALVLARLDSCQPKAVVLFGSATAFLEAPQTAPAPNDLDLMVVSHFPPLPMEGQGWRLPVEVHRFRVPDFVAIATSLRYDPRPLALARLYSDNVARQHARSVIAACLLLGPAYGAFGIEQIEIDARADPRDYSQQRVLAGQAWWDRISAWARERRGPLARLSDKLIGRHEFR